MTNFDVDILIVGGGPTGTSLALELAAQGVSFRVIDKEAVRSDKSRALATQPRSLEILNRHGIGHDIVDYGQYVRGIQLHVHQKPVTVVDLDDLGAEGTQFPLPLMLPQNNLEAVLDSCLARYDRAVERSIVATSITQDADGVTTILERVDGSGPPETVRSRYVVGCDGAHSTVRHAAAGMRFEGGAYAQEFTLCDVRLRGGVTPPPKDRITICMGNGVLAVFPLPDGVLRMVTPVDAGPDVGGGENNGSNKADPTAEEFQTVLERLAPPGWGTVDEALWLARFRLHHRAVSSYRDRRLFVAGDAAHIHSPVGGQGMNTGIQDAVNLGWKLGAVLRGESPPSLLDTYNAERRPVGQALLRGSDRAFSLVVGGGSIMSSVRNAIMPWIMPLIARWKGGRIWIYQFVSEFGISYRGSPVVGTGSGFPTSYWSEAILGGDRASDGNLQYYSASGALEEGAKAPTLQGLLVGPGHHLLLFASSGPARATEEALRQVVDKISPLVRGKFESHFLYSGEGPKMADESRGASSYIDPEGKLHQRYGFAKQPGYVYVRPDGYIAHIGLLAKLDDFLGYLKR